MSDGHGGTDTGTVHVTITPVNDARSRSTTSVVVAQGASDVPLAGARQRPRRRRRLARRLGRVGRQPRQPRRRRRRADLHANRRLRRAGLVHLHRVRRERRARDREVAVTVAPTPSRRSSTSSPRPSAGGRIGASTVPVRLSWRGTDAVTGVVRYQLQQQAAGGAWKTVPPCEPDIDVGRPVAGCRGCRPASGSARGTGRGNWSAYGAWAPIVPQRRQEASAAIAWTGTWHPTADARYSGGHARHATVHARRATLDLQRPRHRAS